MAMNNKFKKLILLLGDILTLYLSLYLALLFRYAEIPNLSSWQRHFVPFTAIFVIWILIFYISDLYNLHLAVNNSKFFNITLRSVAIGGLFSAAFFYTNPSIGITPKTNLIIFLVLFIVLFFIWRRFFNFLLRTYLPKNNIAFIGYNKLAQELINVLQDKPHLGYNVSLIVDNTITDLDYPDIQIVNNLHEPPSS